MTEEKLNEMFIKNKLKGISKIYVPEIRKMLSEAYVNGLEQGKFDTTMDFAYQLNNAINELQLLTDIALDYDGFNNVESLKGLIDEIVRYANNTKNILKGSDKNV